MKRIIATTLATLICMTFLFVTGCTSDTNDERKIPLSQLEQDIIESEVIQTYYSSDFIRSKYTYFEEQYEYTCTDIDIVKERIDRENRSIVTYSNVTIENAYFSVMLYVQTVYNYYDSGGWIMDSLSVEELKQVTPLQGPDERAVSEYLEEYLEGRSFKRIFERYPNKLEGWGSEEGGYFSVEDVELKDKTARVKAQYSRGQVSETGYIAFICTERGWEMEETDILTFIVESANYSCAEGRYVGDNGFQFIDITIISIENNTITYCVNSCSIDQFDSDSVMTGNERTAQFNLLEGSFSIGTYTPPGGSSIDIWLTYNPRRGWWEAFGMPLKRQ